MTHHTAWQAIGVAALVAVAACNGNGDTSGPAASESTSATVPLATSPPTATAAATTTDVSAATSTSTSSTTSTSTTIATTSTTSTSTTTTTTDAPTTTVPGSLLALDVLALIAVEAEQSAGYDRDLFGYPTTIENQCDTRDTVLIAESLTPAQRDPVGCQVIAGDWLSVYDGVTWTDPTELQIDHVVALSEAWDSGAHAWPPDRLVAFGNDLEDPRSLRAVTGAVNNDKGAADPSNWLPPDPAFVCQYLADWIAIKVRWGLSMDPSEHGRIANLLTERCPDQAIAPWPDTPPPPSLPPPSAPSTVPRPPPPPVGNCDPAYPTVCIPPPPPDLDCGDIAERRFTVLPPDPHNFDGRDNDGIGCES